MTVTVVLGAQWGDEGKGRVVDYLSSGARWVVRYQGGNNAGHTVMNDLGEFRLHLIPSGIFFPGVRCLLGAGMVVDLESLLEEIADLEAHGVSTANLFIDRRAHVVWPHHRPMAIRAHTAASEWEICCTPAFCASEWKRCCH
jgi:adenylosuccinate synthase